MTNEIDHVTHMCDVTVPGILGGVCTICEGISFIGVTRIHLIKVYVILFMQLLAACENVSLQQICCK